MKKSELKKEIRERILEKKCKTADIDEMSTSGGAGAYNTPYAFKLKKKDSVNERLGVSKDKLNNIVKFVGAVNFAQMVISLRDENVQDEIVSAFEEQYPAVMDKRDDLQEVDEDRYVRSAFEDLEQVVRNLAHTINISEDEAIEMVIKKLENMLDGRDDLDENQIKEDFMKMGHLATNDDGVKKPIYFNYGYKLVDKSKS